jgi:hypothetical protein
MLSADGLPKSLHYVNAMSSLSSTRGNRLMHTRRQFQFGYPVEVKLVSLAQWKDQYIKRKIGSSRIDQFEDESRAEG